MADAIIEKINFPDSFMVDTENQVKLRAFIRKFLLKEIFIRIPFSAYKQLDPNSKCKINDIIAKNLQRSLEDKSPNCFGKGDSLKVIKYNLLVSMESALIRIRHLIDHLNPALPDNDQSKLFSKYDNKVTQQRSSSSRGYIMLPMTLFGNKQELQSRLTNVFQSSDESLKIKQH